MNNPLNALIPKSPNKAEAMTVAERLRRAVARNAEAANCLEKTFNEFLDTFHHTPSSEQ